MLKPEDTSVPSYGIAPPGFRLPDATHLGAVHLQVSDLQRSLAYYEQVLGLRAQETREGGVLGTQADGRAVLTLQTRPGVTRSRRGTFGLYHFAILLPDRAALGRFAAHLSAMGVQAGMADHLVSEALYLTDPDGLGIEVYADRPRTNWERHGRELAMTTEPLDIANVIASARGEKWDGAPAGTTIGHVHLHVGTLADAEAFYHRALGFDKTVWSYPGALFFSAGGYHHHLGTNVWSPGPAPARDQARLLEWEVIVPTSNDVSAVEHNLRDVGYTAQNAAGDVVAEDPWGTQIRVRAAA